MRAERKNKECWRKPEEIVGMLWICVNQEIINTAVELGFPLHNEGASSSKTVKRMSAKENR